MLVKNVLKTDILKKKEAVRSLVDNMPEAYYTDLI